MALGERTQVSHRFQGPKTLVTESEAPPKLSVTVDAAQDEHTKVCVF